MDRTDEILIPSGIREYLPEGIRVIREIVEETTAEGGGTAPPPTAGQKALILLRRTPEEVSSTCPTGHRTG